MHVLAFVNQKGGCGKTTTALNLAGALAARGSRVLLVDLDPQAHATLGLGCAVEDERSMIDVLIGRVPLAGIVQEAPGGVHLAPATAALAEFEEVAARMVRPERRLEAALAELARPYDFVLLDCPPRADGVLTANALRACDTACLVVECGAFALQGAIKALGIFAEIATDIGREVPVKMIGTLFDKRTRFARELLIAMQTRFGEGLFDTVIRTSVRLREAAACGVPVQVLDPGSRAATEFAALAEEILALAVEQESPSRLAQSSTSAPATAPSPAPSPTRAQGR